VRGRVGNSGGAGERGVMLWVVHNMKKMKMDYYDDEFDEDQDAIEKEIEIKVPEKYEVRTDWWV
jgi:uncharacterized protein (DUF302 family)